MVSLLELIFQGFFEWVYSLILECWNFFFSSLLDIMTLDFAYIKTHVPVVEDIMEVFLAVGWALLLGNLVFQALRSMVSGLGFEGEDPKLLFARTFVFSFLLLASPQICEIGLNLTSRIMDLLEVPDVIDVHLVDNGVFGTLTAAWLLVIIFDIILMFMVLKLLLEVAERYVILAVLAVTAPLAFSMGGSKSTSEIFTGWCRMFGSMCLLMVTNVMFFKMLLSVVSAVPSGLDVFPWMVLNVSIVKVAKKADEIITRIGLNPAITGDKGKGFGSMLAYTMFRGAASKVVKTIGAAATGGASAAAGAVAGGVGAAAGAAGASGTAGAAGAKGAAGAAGGFFRFGGQRGGAQPSGTAKSQPAGTAPQGKSKEADKGPSVQTDRGPSNPSGSAGGVSRKSSVPKGTRRGTSNVTGTTETPGGKPQSGSDSGRGRNPGGFTGGGRLGGGAGRETLQHSGRTDKMASGVRRRGVDVYVDDNFNDGIVGLGKDFPSPDTAPGGTPAGGVRRGGLSGPAKTEPPADATARRGGARRGGAPQGGSPVRPPETRSSRREHVPTPPPPGEGHSPTQTESKQRRSGTLRQEQRSVSTAETTVKKGGGFVSRLDGRPAAGPAGTGEGMGGKNSPHPRRRDSGPVRQEAGKGPVPATSPARSNGAIAPPGPAGTGRVSNLGGARRFRDRSPSPARQELSRGAIPRGVIQKDGTPRIHPKLTGTGGRSPAPPQQRSTNPTGSPLPARQEQVKPPASDSPPLKGGGPAIHTGPAGTGSGPPVRTDSPPRRRSSGPVQQEQAKPPEPAGLPVKGGGPVLRPGGRPAAGPAGTVKGPPAPKRSTRSKSGGLEQGGTHGKPRP